MNQPMEQSDNRWHLDKKVPISIIVVLVMQGVAGIWMIAEIKKDVELLKQGSMEQHLRDERQDKQTSEVIGQLRADIKEVSNKLDRLIERAAK